MGGGEGGEKRKWGADVLATSLGEDPSDCWNNSLPQIGAVTWSMARKIQIKHQL